MTPPVAWGRGATASVKRWPTVSSDAPDEATVAAAKHERGGRRRACRARRRTRFHSWNQATSHSPNGSPAASASSETSEFHGCARSRAEFREARTGEGVSHPSALPHPQGSVEESFVASGPERVRYGASRTRVNRSATQASLTSTDEVERDDGSVQIAHLPSRQELGARDTAIRPLSASATKPRVRAARNARRAPKHAVRTMPRATTAQLSSSGARRRCRRCAARTSR